MIRFYTTFAIFLVAAFSVSQRLVRVGWNESRLEFVCDLMINEWSNRAMKMPTLNFLSCLHGSGTMGLTSAIAALHKWGNYRILCYISPPRWDIFLKRDARQPCQRTTKKLSMRSRTSAKNSAKLWTNSLSRWMKAWPETTLKRAWRRSLKEERRTFRKSKFPTK